MTLLCECGDDVSLAACCPQKRRLRVTTRRGFNQHLQVREQRWVPLSLLLASAARSPASRDRKTRCRAVLDRTHLSDSLSEDIQRHARRPTYRHNAAVAKRDRLARHEQPTTALGQAALHPLVAASDLRGAQRTFPHDSAGRRLGSVVQRAGTPPSVGVRNSGNGTLDRGLLHDADADPIIPESQRYYFAAIALSVFRRIIL